MKNLIVIDDNVIRSMIANPEIVKILPCLQGARGKLDSIAGCSRCAKKKQQMRANTMAAARQCVKSARGETLTKLKQILGTKQIRIVAKNGSGKLIQYTI